MQWDVKAVLYVLVLFHENSATSGLWKHVTPCFLEYLSCIKFMMETIFYVWEKTITTKSLIFNMGIFNLVFILKGGSGHQHNIMKDKNFVCSIDVSRIGRFNMTIGAEETFDINGSIADWSLLMQELVQL